VTAGSLTLGGARGPDELLLNGGTLTLSTTSTVARTGVLASQAYGGIVDLAGGATLNNHGRIIAAGNGIQLSGDVTNANDGLVSVASFLYVDTGRFTNHGAVSVQANGSVQAPHNGGTGAGIENAGGTIVDLGTITGIVKLSSVLDRIGRI
jgi:hypothetical protein